jgi:hypothetical protein
VSIPPPEPSRFSHNSLQLRYPIARNGIDPAEFQRNLYDFLIWYKKRRVLKIAEKKFWHSPAALTRLRGRPLNVASAVRLRSLSPYLSWHTMWDLEA